MRAVHPADGAALRNLACPVCGRTPASATLGFTVVRDKTVVGFVALAVPDADAVYPPGTMLVEQLWVHPDDVGELIGTQLVHRAASALQARRMRRLVARGTRRTSDCGHLPGDWLDRVGFVEHVRGVEWRLDLRRTAPVTDALRAAWGSVARGVRTQRPAPASRMRWRPAP